MACQCPIAIGASRVVIWIGISLNRRDAFKPPIHVRILGLTMAFGVAERVINPIFQE